MRQILELLSLKHRQYMSLSPLLLMMIRGQILRERMDSLETFVQVTQQCLKRYRCNSAFIHSVPTISYIVVDGLNGR